MHLVFVSSLVPSGPPESGYEIANAAVIDGLRRAGARVTVLGFKWPGAELSDPDETVCLGAVDVRTDTAPAGRKAVWLARAVATGLTFSSVKLRVVTAETIEKTLAGLEPYDGLVLNGVPLAGAFESVFTKNPYLFVAHNVEHVSAQENAREAGNIAEKLMYRREARLLEGLERRLCDGAAYVLTLSEDDRAGHGVGSDNRSAVLPLVMPTPPDVETGPRTPAFDIGMIGTWTWTPNRIGLEWFLQEVAPKLHPDISIAVAGRIPKGFPDRDKRVRFLGRVLDATAFLHQCRVIALAARAGTGVQLKTIEMLELGLPAVATPSSLRGIAEPPENVLIADDPAAFADALHNQILGHRAGRVPDLDGAAFRRAQLARMDEVLAAAIHSIEAKIA